LSPPQPPDRIVAVYPDEPLPTNDLVDRALEVPAPAPVRPAVTRVEPPKVEPVKTEPERPAAPLPTLTLKPAAESKTETSIRALLDLAERDLNNVKFAALSADGLTQYNTTKGFIDQAREALKGGNLAFASKLADKARTMAEVLVR
jgi:hypothetical protein